MRLITFGEDLLTGEFRVNDSGTIALPLIGSVHAAGLSPNAGDAGQRGSAARKPGAHSIGFGRGHHLSADLYTGRGQ